MDTRGYMLLILAVSSNGEIYWVQSIEKISTNLSPKPIGMVWWNYRLGNEVLENLLTFEGGPFLFFKWDQSTYILLLLGWKMLFKHMTMMFFLVCILNTEIIERKNDDFQLIYCSQWFQFWYTNNQLAVMFSC